MKVHRTAKMYKGQLRPVIQILQTMLKGIPLRCVTKMMSRHGTHMLEQVYLHTLLNEQAKYSR